MDEEGRCAGAGQMGHDGGSSLMGEASRSLGRRYLQMISRDGTTALKMLRTLKRPPLAML